jgi:hypothetical protein
LSYEDQEDFLGQEDTLSVIGNDDENKNQRSPEEKAEGVFTSYRRLVKGGLVMIIIKNSLEIRCN